MYHVHNCVRHVWFNGNACEGALHNCVWCLYCLRFSNNQQEDNMEVSIIPVLLVFKYVILYMSKHVYVLQMKDSLKLKEKRFLQLSTQPDCCKKT